MIMIHAHKWLTSTSAGHSITRKLRLNHTLPVKPMMTKNNIHSIDDSKWTISTSKYCKGQLCSVSSHYSQLTRSVSLGTILGCFVHVQEISRNLHTTALPGPPCMLWPHPLAIECASVASVIPAHYSNLYINDHIELSVAQNTTIQHTTHKPVSFKLPQHAQDQHSCFTFALLSQCSFSLAPYITTHQFTEVLYGEVRLCYTRCGRLWLRRARRLCSSLSSRRHLFHRTHTMHARYTCSRAIDLRAGLATLT